MKLSNEVLQLLEELERDYDAIMLEMGDHFVKVLLRDFPCKEGAENGDV